MPFNHNGLGREGPKIARNLAELPTGQRCILDRLDLPEDIGRRLMELGFLPGSEIVPARTAPGGGPRVYRVDGSEVALRKETAVHLYIRPDPDEGETLNKA